MSFSEQAFVKKLAELTSSQQSIQTLSLWLIHHRKNSKNIVQVWMKEIRRAKPNKKLTFLYLANDVIQNSRKKGPEFHRDFEFILVDAFRHSAKETDYKSRQAMERILNIWKERGVYSDDSLSKMRKALSEGIGGVAKTESSTPPLTTTPKTAAAVKEDSKKKKRKVELSLREEIEAEFANGPGQVPEPEELVRELQELENAASGDAEVREKIAALPGDVSDSGKLEKLKYKAEGQELLRIVQPAAELLNQYNGRLSAELQDRKRVAKMISDFMRAQKEALVNDEERLQEYRSKLAQVSLVRSELSAHIQSLPDLNLLPDVTGGLAPLPSATDLFSKD